MLSFIISIYLDSNIFSGTVTFGNIIKLLNGKTEIILGKLIIIHKYIDIKYYLN